MPFRLAIVCSHPVQYYAPWFRRLALEPSLTTRVLYLWDPHAASAAIDPEFGRAVVWDTDLRSGYAHEFVANTAARPGTDRFRGLRNPALPARLRAFAPDAVLIFGYGWESLLRLALGWSDCPLVLRGDSHDLGRTGRASAARLAHVLAARLLFRRFGAFAAVGAANRRFYLRRGVPPARIGHVPHCVDNAAFAAAATPEAGSAFRAAHAIPPQATLVAFFGKFIPQKRVDLLLRAFRRATPPNAVLLLVGDGPLAPVLRSLAGDSPVVRFVPFLNQSQMPAALAAADLLALPSDSETWGLVVNEAMASGLPALVSDRVGCREDLVEEGATGWSFPAGDEDALAAALSRALAALREPGARERFRRAARTRADAHSYDAATRGLQALLDALPPRLASSSP